MGYPSWRHNKANPEQARIIYSAAEEEKGWEDPSALFAVKSEPKKDEPSNESQTAEDKKEVIEPKPKKAKK
jgi:hypothetical protein